MAGAAQAPVVQLVAAVLLSCCPASSSVSANARPGVAPASPAIGASNHSLLDTTGWLEDGAGQHRTWSWHVSKQERGGGREAGGRSATRLSTESRRYALARRLQMPPSEEDLMENLGEWETVRTFSLSPRNTSEDDVLRIGTVFSMSSAMGEAFLDAYWFFLARVATYPQKDQLPYGVELHVYDHLGENYMEEVMESMMQRGIRLFLGPTTFDGTSQAARLVQEAGNLIVCPAASDLKQFESNRRVFGTAVPMGNSLSSAIDLLASRGARTVAVIAERAPEASGACDAVPEQARRVGLQVVLSQVISYDTNDVALMRLLQDKTPDVVILCSDDQFLCELFFRSLYSYNVNPKALLVSGGAWEGLPTLMTTVNPRIWLGHWALGIEPQFQILPLSLGSEPITQEEFKVEVVNAFGYEEADSLRPGFLPAYTAIASIFLAAQQARSTSPTDIAAALNNLANITFDGSGMKMMDFNILQRADDTVFWPHVVGPPTSATHDLIYPRPPYRDWICYQPSTNVGVHMGMRPVTPASTELACQECPEHMMSVHDFNLNYFVCEECPRGRVMVQVQDVGNCLGCDPGRMHDPVARKCTLCPEGRFQNVSEQTFCHACPAGSYQGRPGETQCSACKVLAMDGVTFYNTEPALSSCHVCPAGALCEEDAAGLHSTITTKDAHYLLPSPTPGEQPTAFYCPHGKGQACRAYGRCMQDPESGEESMESLFCGKCKKGFAKLDDHYSVCGRCKGLGNAVRGILFNIFVMSMLVSVVALMIMTTDFSRPTQLHSVVIKQFFNYLHMARVVTGRVTFSLFPGYDLVGTIEFLTSITGLQAFSTGFSTFSVSCFTDEALPLEPFQTVQVLGLVWVPLSMLAIWAGFETCRALALRWGASPPRRERLTTLFTVYLFFMLSPVTEMNLTSWNCYHYDQPRSAHDPSLLCFSKEIQRWQIAGVMGTILYSLGIPFGLYLLLLYYERQDKLRDPDVCKMLGFLTSGFESDHWYFECIYMLRKVLFTLVLQLPGLSASDARETRDIQNMILVLNCGVFLAMQLYFQPYDNRGYFVLDKIETASLTAIMVTPLLGVWLSDRNHAYLFKNDWTNRLQQVVCMIIISGLHGRALAWVLWGTMRGYLMSYVRDHQHYWFCRKLLTVIVPGGSATVTSEGMELRGVQGISWKLLSDMLTGLLFLQADKTGSITYEGFAASVQRVMVETHVLREVQDFHHQNPLRSFIRTVKQRVQRLPCGKELLVALIQRAEDYLRLKGYRVSDRKGAPKPRSSSAVSASRSTRSRVFTAESLAGTYGEEFSIEEIHAAFTLLRNDAFQEFSPLNPLDEVPVSHASSTTTRTTAYSERPARAISDEYMLTVEQVVDSALRAHKQEKLAEVSDLQTVKAKNQKLEQDLRQMEVRLAETQAALSRAVLRDQARPSEPAVDPGLANTAQEEAESFVAQEFVVAVEENSRRPTATRPPRASGTRLSMFTARADSQQAAEPETGTHEEGALHREPTISNTRRSQGALHEEAGDEVKPELEKPKAKYKKLLTKQFAQQPPPSEKEEVDLGSIHVNLMQEEVASLARQRDEAILQAEKAELSLERLKYQLRDAQLESAENIRMREQVEARVEKLEAANSSWKRWAKHAQISGATVEEFNDGLLHTLQHSDGVSAPEQPPRTSPVGQTSKSQSAFLKSCSPATSQKGPGWN